MAEEPPQVPNYTRKERPPTRRQLALPFVALVVLIAASIFASVYYLGLWIEVKLRRGP